MGTNYNSGSKLTIKGLIIGGLVLLLLIPTIFVNNIIRDRADRQKEVQNEISSNWAGKQTLVGPILVIPCHANDSDRKLYYHVLPNDLAINGDILPHIKSRSIFNVTVYQSALKLSGSFTLADIKKLNVPYENMLLNEARLCFTISDISRGLEKQPALSWNGKESEMDAELFSNNIIKNSINTIVDLSEQQEKYNFIVDVNLRGSSSLMIAPVGKTTTAQLTSKWQHPSFAGNFLPGTSTVDKDGFSANWSVLSLNRALNSWFDNNSSEQADIFGVDLYQPDNVYSRTNKSIKYAILLIALSFVLYFFIEIFQKRSVHPLQYILVGLALCVFYTLLLSISEYMSFINAYIIATAATVTLITLYTKSIFSKWGTAAIFGGVLSMLYMFVLVLIQLQDTALLIGSVGLFMLLAAIMYFSRKIDWYARTDKNDDELDKNNNSNYDLNVSTLFPSLEDNL